MVSYFSLITRYSYLLFKVIKVSFLLTNDLQSYIPSLLQF